MEFPIECGPPRKLIRNIKEYLNYINLYNGKKKAIYRSIYYFTKIEDYKPDYNSAVVDCIFFDFDDKSCNAWEECNKLHQECLKDNLKHKINMSGRGYHLYILTASTNLNHKKEAVRGGQMYFIDKLKLKVDTQVIGNIAQLARIPNTFHPKAGRFCIPLTQQQFENGDSFIKELAKNQNFVKNIIIGNKLLDLKIWDIKGKDEFEGIIPSLNTSDSCINLSTIKDFPLCISKLMENKNLGWKGRYLVILYMKEKGYSKEDCYKLLKEFLSDIKLRHCITEEKQLQYLFGRNDLIFPSCKRLKEDGFCVEKCKFFENGIYR